MRWRRVCELLDLFDLREDVSEPLDAIPAGVWLFDVFGLFLMRRIVGLEADFLNLHGRAIILVAVADRHTRFEVSFEQRKHRVRFFCDLLPRATDASEQVRELPGARVCQHDRADITWSHFDKSAPECFEASACGRGVHGDPAPLGAGVSERRLQDLLALEIGRAHV